MASTAPSYQFTAWEVEGWVCSAMVSFKQKVTPLFSWTVGPRAFASFLYWVFFLNIPAWAHADIRSTASGTHRAKVIAEPHQQRPFWESEQGRWERDEGCLSYLRSVPIFTSAVLGATSLDSERRVSIFFFISNLPGQTQFRKLLTQRLSQPVFPIRTLWDFISSLTQSSLKKKGRRKERQSALTCSEDNCCPPCMSRRAQSSA